MNAVSPTRWSRSPTSRARSFCSIHAIRSMLAFLRGTTADNEGNVTMEREAATLDGALDRAGSEETPAES